MNDHGEGKVCCDFHPEEILVGVCAHCLKKRLLVLASKQGQLASVRKKAIKFSSRAMRRKRIIRIPKVLALAGPFLYRFDSRYRRSKDDSEDDEEGSDGSNEDSFISVKFDDNGCAWWDTKESISTGTSTVSNIRSESNRNKHMVVAKTKKSNTFKWKKRLGQFLQLTQPKKANDKISSHLGFDSKVEGSKGRRGWVIRSLIRRKTTKRQSRT
ncbi:uncharacterized protein LOC141834170 [Curcuma longa]|uniref:uncharacterized protein LOC141834170 n=1 Tax=Curcuma longa TaxID=136217 RepID=UPI003D9F237C